MARTIYKWRQGVAPNYTYTWAEGSPGADAVVVDTINESVTTIKQERATVGHYFPKPLVIGPIPSGTFRYKDIVIPDYTNGLDLLSVHLDLNQVDTGDEIACGKVLIGQIGVLAANADIGATSITIATTVQGVLMSTVLGGALDEGLNLSFGTENSTDTSLNATPPTGDPINCDQELKEYEIKRFGAETDVGGGLYTCTVTLFSGLAAGQAANTPVNLIFPFVKEVVPLTKVNHVISLGGETLSAGNIPANKRVRFGYKNNGASEKTIRAAFGMMF